MTTDWEKVEEGSSIIIVKRKDAINRGLPGPLTGEVILVCSHEHLPAAILLQCSRANLVELLRGLAPSEVHILKPDADLEMAVRQGTKAIVH